MTHEDDRAEAKARVETCAPVPESGRGKVWTQRQIRAAQSSASSL